MLRLASFLTLSILVSAPAHAGPTTAPIVGGTEVPHDAWPDVVAIIGEHDELCTGTLIAADLVLTAAHCIEARPREVIIGSIDLARPDGDVRTVKWARAYPEWLDRYDIGVIMLEHPVFAKQRAIAQGCSARDLLAAGSPLQVVGFGLTTKSGDGDNTRLHQAIVPVVDPTCTSDPACVSAVAPGGELIAGGHGADACFGDSGGPAYVTTAQGPALIGVVSRGLATWDEPCGEGGIYVRADKVVKWIESVSGRRLDRVPCDLPADGGGGAVEPGGCNAGGSLHGSFVLIWSALVIAGLRRAKRK